MALIGAFAVVAASGLTRGDKSSLHGAERTRWTTSKLVGTPEPPAPYTIQSAFPEVRFQKPTSLEELPGAKRLLVTEMAGRISTIAKDPTAKASDLVGDLRELLPGEFKGRDVALFDAALHPKFLENRFLFACYVSPVGGRHTRVSRFTLTADAAPKLVAGSEKVVITWPAGGHNAGCLEFGKDGMLYIATGDGSGPNPPDGLTTGQDVTDLLGAILRIDVDQDDAEKKLGYRVPTDNPFVSLKDARPEIWAYGLRNPWKFGVDRQSGEIFAADNGWESWEMVHRIVRGGNCGWPVMEGRAALRTEVKVGPTPILPPAVDHPHTEANSVIGGTVYRGGKLTGLVGSFIYGDYITGTIWALKANSEGAYVHSTLVDTDLQIVAFAEGRGGELFVLDYDVTGQIYELTPSNSKDNSANFPRRLSETGLFKSLKTLEPAPGVEPYSVKVARWMDGAEGQRWIALPGDGQVRLATDSKSTAVFPDGAVLVKQLSLPGVNGNPPVRLETQILHFEDGTWRPYSYRWDDAGEDAVLVDGAVGASRQLRLGPKNDPTGALAETYDRTWHVNATNECKLCHNAGAKFVLGFVPQQLDRALSGSTGGVSGGASSGAGGQLAALAGRGVIATAPQLAADDPLRLVDPHDAAGGLDDRARSYLHVNCSMCHHLGGNAIVSFYLRRDMPFEKLNTYKGTGIGTFGMRDAKLIVPGDPYRSVLMYRMSKLGYARMPYIGSRVVDGAGVALIEQWIRGMTPKAGDTLSGPATSGSDDAVALADLAPNSGRPQDRREAAIARLLKSTEGSLALIGQLHRGGLTRQDAAATVIFASRVGSTDVRGLFDTFIPESQRRPTLGPKIDPQVVLSRAGDVQRGKLIFFSDGARCRACHHADDKAQSLGPTLREINKKYPRPAEMLQHVLQPSLKIDEPYAAYQLLTEDGRAFSGLLTQQSDQEVTVTTAEKRAVRVARKNVAELKKSEKSLMPDQILGDLTAQEAADLLEYIRSLGAAP